MVKGKQREAAATADEDEAVREPGTPETADGNPVPPKKPRRSAAARDGFVPPLADASTLAGDLRDAMLSRLRAAPVIWSRMTEAEQREEIRIAGEAAAALIDDAVALIHGCGAPSIVARVKRATTKKDLEIVLTCARNHPARHALVDRVEESVMIVLADPNRFYGESAPAEFDPDEPELDVAPRRKSAKAAARRPVTGGASMPPPAASREGDGSGGGAPMAKGKVKQSEIFKRPLADDMKDGEPAHDPETGEIVDDAGSK